MSGDECGRVRIWDKDWNCLVDEHEQDGDTASDVIQRAVETLGGSVSGDRKGDET